MKHKKQILKTILLLLLPAFVVAQDYPAFPLENSTWTEQNAIFEDYPPQTWTSLFVTENDTLINDISYCNVYEYYLNPSTFDTIRKLYSSVRQDTTAKEVFIIRHYLDEEFERVLLSFNHAVGDTVLLDAYYWHLYPQGTDSLFYVDSIAELNLYNGEQRKVHYLSNHKQPFHVNQILIEGVGSIFNPFGPPTDLVNKKQIQDEFCCPDYLLCLVVEDEIIYALNNSKDCGSLEVWTSLENRSYNIGTTFYPNPVIDFLTIEIQSTYLDAQLIFYDSFGNILIKTDIKENRVFLDLRSIKIGFYILKLIINNQIETYKIIVKH